MCSNASCASRVLQALAGDLAGDPPSPAVWDLSECSLIVIAIDALRLMLTA
jgi:hypothetical protein